MHSVSSRLHTRLCDLQPTIIALDITKQDFCSGSLPLYVKYWCTDADDFIDYMVDIENTSVILITSNLLASIAIDILRPLFPQIKRIYILELQSLQIQRDHKEYEYFRDTESLLDFLLRETTTPVWITHQSYSVERSINDLRDGYYKYVWFQLLLDLLSRLKRTRLACDEMLQRIRDFHPSRVQNIVERNCRGFEENYNSKEIIRWYTRTSFFYIALNRALRSEDINQIFSYRYVISDTQNALKELQKNQSPLGHSIVYRGQQMDLIEVKSIADKVGSIIGMTTFWPATSDQELAVHVAKVPLREVPSIEQVLFHINIPNHRRQSACVDISHISSVDREQQLIFPLDSLFRIEAVSRSKHLWHIELTLVDENDNQFTDIMNSYKVSSFDLRSFFSATVNEKDFFRDLPQENMTFIRFQLLIDMILRLDRNDFAWNELLEVCRKNSSSNPSELEKINAFAQTYRSKDAVQWYTKDCFLYRLLNKALRDGDIDHIVKLRYFVHDLHNQLVELQFDFLRTRSQNQSILTLYRGSRMSKSEFDQFRHYKGHFMSTNSFLSTTQDFQAALFFSGEGNLDDSEVSIIYKISVDISIAHSVPFASIEYQSIFQDEDEVLFSIGAVFRIGQMKEIGEHLWTIRLTLTPQQEELWANLTRHLKTK